MTETENTWIYKHVSRSISSADIANISPTHHAYRGVNRAKNSSVSKPDRRDKPRDKPVIDIMALEYFSNSSTIS